MKALTLPILIACGGAATHTARFIAPLNELLPIYGIDTPLRLAHFLSQILHESDHLRAVREYASGSEYEGRRDLGNTQKGDGVRFAGRGILQVTGRSNYTAFAKKYGVDCVAHPELLENPRWATVAALWYWQSRNLNAICDLDDAKTLTRKINGGLNGLAERLQLLAGCKIALAPLFT